MLKGMVLLGLVSIISCCFDSYGTSKCLRMKKSDPGYCEKVFSHFYCEKTCGHCNAARTTTQSSGITTTQSSRKTTIQSLGTTTTTQSLKTSTYSPDKDDGVCGVSKALQGRIVNGVESVEGAWPWIASIQTVMSGFHFCGGALLTPTWVLTASHCVTGRKSNPSAVQVVLGAHDKGNPYEKTQQVRRVRRIIAHPKYGHLGGLHADFALMELSSPVILNDRVVKACMPKHNVYPKVGQDCFIAGWGSIGFPSGGSPRKLQQAKLPVVGGKHTGCHYNKEVVCVGHGFGTRPDGSQHPNACRGDSGGPLMCKRTDGRWVVEGVASYVYEYCKYYTAYAPVNKYLSWIQQYVPGL